MAMSNASAVPDADLDTLVRLYKETTSSNGMLRLMETFYEFVSGKRVCELKVSQSTSSKDADVPSNLLTRSTPSNITIQNNTHKLVMNHLVNTLEQVTRFIPKTSLVVNNQTFDAKSLHMPKSVQLIKPYMEAFQHKSTDDKLLANPFAQWQMQALLAPAFENEH